MPLKLFLSCAQLNLPELYDTRVKIPFDPHNIIYCLEYTFMCIFVKCMQISLYLNNIEQPHIPEASYIFLAILIKGAVEPIISLHIPFF